MKNNKKKIFRTLLAVLLGIACIGSLCLSGSKEVEAAAIRLNGIQKIVDEISTESPFVILELVPDEAYASFGAYVLGEEPAVDAKLLTGVATESARAQKVAALLNKVAADKKDTTVNWAEYPMYYDTDTVPLYEERVSAPENMDGWNVLELAAVEKAEKTGYFEAVAEGQVGDYKEVSSVDEISNTSEEPRTEEPRTEEPGTEEPGTEEPGTEEPGTEEPETEEPGTEEPGTEEPGTEEPGTEEPGTEEPGTEEPGTEEPGTEEPGTEEPTTEDPVEEATLASLVPESQAKILEIPFTAASESAGEPETEEPGTEEPSAVEPITEEPDNENKTQTEPEVSYVYAPGEGTHRWVDSEDPDSAKTYTITYGKVYYRVNVTSNNWFVNKVFEYEAGKAPEKGVQVVSLTAKQLQENIDSGYIVELSENHVINDWSGIGLLYISNSSCLNLETADLDLLNKYTKANDFSGETGYILYEYVFNTSFPVIVDSSLTAAELTDDSTNLEKLAYLLWDYTPDMQPNSYKNGTQVINLSTWAEQWPAGLSEALMKNTKNKAFGTHGSVQGSVYFNSDGNMVSETFSHTITFEKIEAVSEGTIYSAQELIVRGVSEVFNEISTENIFNEINNIGFTTEYNTEKGEIQISDSTLIKSILNFGNRKQMLYKDTIKILDVEPTKYSTLTEDDVKGWLKPVDAERIKKIVIERTTPQELIGLLTDLEGNYDLIYFGDCIGPKDKAGALNRDAQGNVIYNDEKMNGLIYTHVGDIYEVQHRYSGMLDEEYLYDANGKKTQLNPVDLRTRFAGNDLTKDKVAELKAYADAGYPVIVADTYYSVDDAGTVNVNGDRVDNTSYFYELFDYCKNKDNMMLEGELDPEKENGQNSQSASRLAMYLNLSRLKISMISAPVEYAVVLDNNDNITSAQFLQPQNGKYVLEYVFELSNISGTDTVDTFYNASLFVDTNADGRYDSTEELDGLTVVDMNTSEVVNENALKTGVRYAVSRELPDGYVGMLPWKLQVSQNGKVGIHTNQVGYTAIRADEKINIKVLQIMPGSGLDLSKNTTFKNLFTDVEKTLNYKIDLSGSKSSANYVKEYKDYCTTKGLTVDSVQSYTGYYNDVLSQYDMIIIGFKDMVDDIESYGAVMALKMFIESGRSVLFSHDTASHVNAEKSIYKVTVGDSKKYPDFYNVYYWGYHLNRYIRSVVGMDRYGVTEDSLNFLKKSETLSQWDDAEKAEVARLQKDVAYVAKSGKSETYKQVHGLDDSAMVRILTKGNNQKVTIDNKTYYKPIYLQNGNRTLTYEKSGATTSHEVTTISQVNKGQITTYPYDINISHNDKVTNKPVGGVDYKMTDLATMTVAKTHCQYYQLDMNMDKSGDNKGDMVVWYCLTESMYDDIPNDVRNDYYIYSVGNVMYTGMGHSGANSTPISEDEAKLFVNTMIASYNAGVRNPSISIIQNEENRGVIKEYSYRTYDEEIKLVDNANETIWFYANDNNIINGTRDVTLRYYVEVEPAIDGANKPEYITKILNGEEVILRPLKEGEIISVREGENGMGVGNIVVNKDLLNTRFGAVDGEGKKITDSVRFYISAQTELIYEGNRGSKTTEEVFTCLTVKVRDLFDLD